MMTRDDIAPGVIVSCKTHQAEFYELSEEEKDKRIANAAEHEAREQQKAAEKAAADAMLRVLAGNPQASVKAEELLVLLKQLGFDPAAVSQTKSG